MWLVSPESTYQFVSTLYDVSAAVATFFFWSCSRHSANQNPWRYGYFSCKFYTYFHTPHTLGRDAPVVVVIGTSVVAAAVLVVAAAIATAGVLVVAAAAAAAFW